MEVSIFGVLLVSSSFAATGHLSASLAQVPVFGQAAGIALFSGCLVALVGIFWRDHDDALIIQQFGLALTSLGCLFYATALFMNALRNASLAPSGNTLLLALTSAAIPMGYSVGVGIGSGVRYFQIQRYVRHRTSES
jgi:hypothetical protein